MRLIDADALMATLGITDMDCNKCAWHDREWSNCKRGSDFEDACCAIENAPTIEERKTGKWIHQKYHCDDPDGETIFVEFVSCECSECGLYVQQPCNFCPDCGAKMEGEKP